jgi:peptide/nickel transport system ATP-binding protein
MYAGKVVEEVRASELMAAKHPYTRGLLNCLPKIEGDQRPLPTLKREEAWAE